MENGPKAENGKKLANRKWPTARNGKKLAQKWPKIEKWPQIPFFHHFWAIFAPLRTFSIFGPIFSHFWISPRFAFYSMRPDSQTQMAGLLSLVLHLTCTLAIPPGLAEESKPSLAQKVKKECSGSLRIVPADHAERVKMSLLKTCFSTPGAHFDSFCGPLSCTRLRVPPVALHVCCATRVAADFLDFRAFCRCSTGVALHPLKILVSHLPPPVPGGVAPKFGSEKVSRYTGVSQLQLRVSRFTVQLRWTFRGLCPGFFFF